MSEIEKKINLVLDCDDNKFRLPFRYVEKKGGLTSFINEALKWNWLMKQKEFLEHDEKFCNAGGYIP